MKINEYYRDVAQINLNGSIAALFPTIVIIGGNLSFFQKEQIMLLTLPFFLYSLYMFQMYLFKMKQALTIGGNLNLNRNSLIPSLFDSKFLLVVRLNTSSAEVQFYFPNGHLAGRIIKWKGKHKNFLSFSKYYALYDSYEEPVALFKVKNKKQRKVEVFDRKGQRLGCLETKKGNWNIRKKELFDSSGRFYGTITGSAMFMDEQILNQKGKQMGRLRRGWMPLEWSSRFPEANTPVLSFHEPLSEKEKLLYMTLLVNEFFIER